MVLDYVPDEDQIEEFVFTHLDDFPADEASARVEVLYAAPDWMGVADRDQISAHLRDGSKCVLVIYMYEGTDEDEDDDAA